MTTTDAATNTPATKHYHYEDNRSLNTHALTGLTDALGVRITTYTYDAQGQVASTEKAQGLEKLTFQFSSPVGANSVIFYTPAPDAASTATLYGFSSLAGVLRPTSVSSPPCPLCGASAAATSYDANQRKSKVIAHDGSVTFYTYNAKGRVTREATYPASYQSAMTAPPLAAADSVSSTQWHGTWNLPLKVAEAYLITSYGYDERGNLLEMVETQTTDATGAKGFNATPNGETQTTRWTYDAKNLPITIVELEGGVETGRWDLAYNPTGDLTGITHVTSGTVATLVPQGNGASQVTAISGASATGLTMMKIWLLGLVSPASAASLEMPMPWGGSIAVGDIINVAKLHPIIRFAGFAFTAGTIIKELICEDDDSEKKCKTATDFHLRPKIIPNAGYKDEHDFKRWNHTEPFQDYDICACEDGSVVIRGVKQCGKQDPTIPTYDRWK